MSAKAKVALQTEQDLPERDVKLMCSPPDRAGDLWPACRDWIQAAYDEADEIMPEDILARFANRTMLLWVVTIDNVLAAAMTTMIITKKSGKVYSMTACGGHDLKEWQAFHTKIEAHARAEGCIKVILEGRPGWGRALEGYKVARHVLEKVL